MGAESGRGRGEVLWTPPDDAWTVSAIGRFATQHGFSDYASLHAWSVDDLAGFWKETTDFCGVRWESHPVSIIEHAAMPGARWFVGGEMNYAAHALARAHDPAFADRVAIVSRSQTREPEEVTWPHVADQVRSVASWLRGAGVEAGDRVVGYSANIPETLVAFLAAASIGAVWSSCAPEFGVRSVIDRFAQIDPKVLFAIDGYGYGAKAIDRSEHVSAIVAGLTSLERVVLIPYLDDEKVDTMLAGDRRRHVWADVVASRNGGDGGDGDGGIVPVAADHPLYVLFSSGTTGLPKAIVHGHGGVTAEHLKVLTFHQDLTEDDRFFWFTTTGWMMWNYLVSGLLTGSTLILFDGDPGSPDLHTLWDLAEDTGCTVFGASAPFLMSCRKAAITPNRGELRWVGSTGAPLPAAGFRWVHDEIGVPVSSIAGGTDVCTAFVGSSPLVPVRAGEISCRLLGCAVEAFDPTGAPCPTGMTGELVVTQPMPSMPIGFWGDADGSRYRSAYFEEFPGVWRHGDWVTFTDDGACVITGRSDATLNRGGVRLGTSDFYAVVEQFEEVLDSLVVHLDDADEDGASTGLGHLVLFVSLVPGVELDDGLMRRLRAALRTELSPRHIPDSIEAAPSVPRTLSGKKLEVPVKRVLQGAAPEEVASRDALADPGALDWYAERATRAPAPGARM